MRVRIIAFIAAILAVGAVVLGIAAWQSAELAAREAYDRLLTGGTIQIAENVYVQGGVLSVEPPVAAIATMSAYDLVFYKVVDPRDVVVAGYDDLSSRADPAGIRTGIVLEDGVYQGQTVRIATIAKKIDGSNSGSGSRWNGGWATITVAQTVEARRALTHSLTMKAIGLIGMMSILALLAGAFSVRLALAPLTRIEKEIARRRPDDLRPIDVAPPPEVRNLVGAIDDFMVRLSERIAVMQRFIADAAHQIRTPLAALDAQVQLLADAADDRDRTDHIARIQDRTRDLGRLTSQLLGHAMVIHRAGAVRAEPMDLNQLAKSTLAYSVPLSLEREVAIAFLPSAAAPIVGGDAISLREALANLIDNALAHGARTRLSVAVGAEEDGTAWIAVCDDGDGIAPEDAERLLKPFEKGNGGSGGSGLGLAIALEVARAHGGTLTLTRTEDDFCARLSLRR